MNIAFAGLRHGHIFILYDEAVNNPYFNVCGAFEENEEARIAAEEKGVKCNYKTFEELLNDKNVDVVALGGCYGDRGAMALAALNSGKHVIADKPLCISLQELDKIKEAASKNNKLVSTMFTMRFEPVIRGVKAFVESGALGEINNVYFGGQHPLQYGRRPMWYFEDGKHGGVINDIAIHGIDILSFALGVEVENCLSARSWNKFAKEQPKFKDCGQFMLSGGNNEGIIADVSYAVPDGVEFALPYYWDFRVWGTKGVLIFSLGENKGEYYIDGDANPHTLEPITPECEYLTDFYRYVGGEDNTVLTMEEVFRATEKTLKINAIAENGGCEMKKVIK